MPVTDAGAVGEPDHVDTLDKVRLEARAAGAQALAASCVAGGARLESVVVSTVVCWII